MKNNAILLTSGLCALGATTLSAQNEKPNILIFMADDLGWEEVGAYGHPVVKTPNIDQLASNGMRFDNFYLTASSSSPSRSSILTGMYPSCTGAMNLHEDMPAYINLVTDRLKDNGYYTILAGKSHGTNRPAVKERFDHIKLIDWSKPWTMIELWKEALNNRPKDKPFCMLATSIDPHRPYKQGNYEKPYSPTEVIIPPYLHDSPEMREELADYYNEITRFDDHIGQTIDLLRQQGVLDNTLIIVMSDNGRPFPQSKTRVNVQGLKSAFIVHYPKIVAKGQTTKSLVSAVDIAPTLLDVAGLKKVAGMQGVSMMPIMKNPTNEIREYAFAEHNWHVFKAYERAVITKEYLYIRNWITQVTNPTVVEVMRMPSYEAMLSAYQKGELSKKQQDTFIAPRAEEELFNIGKDIHCLDNIVAKKQERGMKEKLSLVLNVWQESIGDKFPGDKNLKQDTSDRITGEAFKKEK